MLGAIIGDIVGSTYEWQNVKRTDFSLRQWSRFTDDSVLTVAVAEALLDGEEYGSSIKRWARRYPNVGYGGNFYEWMQSDVAEPYYSFGNGSAMRVSPIGWAFDTLEETLAEAERSAECTHNHPEGIKGALSAAGAIFLARSGKSKDEIKSFIETTFLYDLDRTIDGMRPYYSFEVSCQHSVPQAIIAFLESSDYEHAVRLAVSLGGDSDTIACITGGIAEAFYGEIPDDLVRFANVRLTDEMKRVIEIFCNRYFVRKNPR